MEPFFEVKKKPAASRKSRVKNKKPVNRCDTCGLYKKCNTPKMKVSGKGRLKILIIGEAPGKNEDLKGKQFVGVAGDTLKKRLLRIGIELRKDCWITNAIICRPPDNKMKVKYLSACHKNLDKTIRKLKPEKIIIFGKWAMQSFMIGRESSGSIDQWVGWTIPDQKYNCWVFPTYHPQFLNYNQDDIILNRMFDEHIKTAYEWKKPLPDNTKDEDKIKILKTPEKIYKFLDKIKSGSIFAFDIETTGKKPYAEGHEILTISMAFSSDKAYAFPYLLNDKTFIKKLKRVMEDKLIKKIAHNFKFEHIWLMTISNIHVKGWKMDTMIVAHILDSRRKITGLKFQTYVWEGVAVYDNEVDSFIESSDSKNANSFNRLKDCDIKKVLLYNGLDSLYTFRLYKRFKKMMVKDTDGRAYRLFHKGLVELAKVEDNGINIDMDYYNSQFKELTDKMKSLDKKIANSPEVKKWKKKTGNKYFNHSSHQQLKKLLFEIMDYSTERLTKSGAFSTDQEALEKIKTKFVKSILEFRKYKKIRDTYLLGFMRHQTNNKLHATFNLNIPRTYRPSTSDPNLANVPKHEEDAQRITRSGIVPSSGRQIVEVDYSGIEVRVSACYHRDPMMLRYINNPKSDMHRDQAQELFLKDEVTKQERFLAKNNFVFAQFYGDWWKSCAEGIWKNLERETKAHLKEQGIKSLGKLLYKKDRIVDCTGFYRHVAKVENKFWNEKFRVYNEWKKRTWEEYQEKGYLVFFTGFICKGHLKKNEVLNHRIQGTAFHLLLWSLIKINRYLKKYKFDTTINLQIYDSLVFDMVPDERKELFPIIRKVMTEDIRKEFPWIIVPLDIEAEISKKNGNWYEIEEKKI